MATVASGALVSLEELVPSSPYFKHGVSLRVTGKLQEYNVGTAVAVILDRNASFEIDTRHLNLNLRVGSIFQFIGELHLEPDHEDKGIQKCEAILKARVGRNVDGMDLNLYRQSLQLLRDFQAA